MEARRWVGPVGGVRTTSPGSTCRPRTHPLPVPFRKRCVIEQERRGDITCLPCLSATAEGGMEVAKLVIAAILVLHS